MDGKLEKCLPAAVPSIRDEGRENGTVFKSFIGIVDHKSIFHYSNIPF